MKKAVFFLAIALLVSLMCNYQACTKNDAKTDTVTVELVDTFYLTKTDTLPVIRTEKVVKYISVPCADSVSKELQPDSTVPLAVVQRTYSDDSTYTAYVSGIKYEELPKLDSISVRQRTIVREIERTITIHEQKPLTIGLQVGAGYGVINHQPDIYIGIGFQLNLK